MSAHDRGSDLPPSQPSPARGEGVKRRTRRAVRRADDEPQVEFAPATNGVAAESPAESSRHAGRPLPPPLRGRVGEGGAPAAGMTSPAHEDIPPAHRGRARSLRRNMTDAERRLWAELRAHRFEDAGFRRQVPLGAYVADFVCHRAKLIIELDGGQHGAAAQAAHDARRTAWLEGQGFRVLRFWNTDVLTNLEGVLTCIAAELAAVPTSQPSPVRGEGFKRGTRRAVRRADDEPQVEFAAATNGVAAESPAESSRHAGRPLPPPLRGRVGEGAPPTRLDGAKA
jgi:very-short-patch-repair endonuclease